MMARAHETARHCETALGLSRRMVDGDGREDAQDRLGRLICA
jgi:hypothetical protein